MAGEGVDFGGPAVARIQARARSPNSGEPAARRLVMQLRLQGASTMALRNTAQQVVGGECNRATQAPARRRAGRTSQENAQCAKRRPYYSQRLGGRAHPPDLKATTATYRRRPC